MNVRNDMSVMKKWLIVLAGAALLVVCAAAVFASACGGTESRDKTAALGELPDGSDPVAPGGSSDLVDAGDEPLHEDGDPYEVTVLFNTSVMQEDIIAVEATLRGRDANLEFVVMESFPPIGRAIMARDGADFCATVEAELVAESYVDGISCGPWEAPTGGDPDEPVSQDNEPSTD